MSFLNYAWFLAFLAFAGLALWRAWKTPLSTGGIPSLSKPWFPIVFAVIFCLLGAWIRLWAFPSIPAGFNQDEASLGYDAFAILNFGIDRNGYHFPVYPVAWGAGHGPFYMYFCMPFLKIFGTSVGSYRIGNVLLSIVSLPAFFFLLRRLYGPRIGLIGLFLLAIAPWSVFQSRWALDANPLPSLWILACSAFVYGLGRKGSFRLLLSAVLFVACLYTYGTALVAIPLFLFWALGAAFSRNLLTRRQLVYFLALFVTLCIPMGLFLLINYGGLPEIVTSWISVPKLTGLRSESVFRNFDAGTSVLTASLKGLWDLLLQQGEDPPWNSVPLFGSLYRFSSPLILLGMGLMLERIRKPGPFSNRMGAAMLGATCILVLLIEPNGNRANLLFVSMTMALALAIDFVWQRVRWGGFAILACFVLGFVSFSNFYLQEYNQNIGIHFFSKFEEAVQFADRSTTGRVCVTHGYLNAPYMLTMFHVRQDPRDYLRTVVYEDPNSEFRMAKSFGKFEFGLPPLPTPDRVYVLHENEQGRFSPNIFRAEHFGKYVVMSPR